MYFPALSNELKFWRDWGIGAIAGGRYADRMAKDTQPELKFMELPLTFAPRNSRDSLGAVDLTPEMQKGPASASGISQDNFLDQTNFFSCSVEGSWLA